MGRFQPITEKQAMEAGRTVLDAGVYHFKVIEASEQARKATGALMFRVALECWGDGTEKARVYDYICTDVMEHKLRHFAYAIGEGENYEAGELYAADLLDRTGQVSLRIEDDEQYGRRNIVQDYETTPLDPQAKHEERVALPTPEEAKQQAETDSIPF